MTLKFAIAASAIGLALTGATMAGNGFWTPLDFQGEPAISYDGPDFGVIMACNSYGNLGIRMLTDKRHFDAEPSLGARLGGGSLVVMRDDAVVVTRNAFREDDMGHIGVFSANLTPDQVSDIAESDERISFAILEDGQEISFIAVARVDDFKSKSEEAITQCRLKYSN